MSNNENGNHLHDGDDEFSNHPPANSRPQFEHHSPEIPGFRRTEGRSQGGAATVVFESIGREVRSVYGDLDAYND
jgi:hypothetical protein